MRRNRSYRQPARGTVEWKLGPDHPKICIRFERAMFDQINDHAKQARLTFAEAARSLIGYAFDKLAQEEDTPMSDPASYDEYMKRFKLGETVNGYGIDTSVSTPCPFCAAPDFMKFKIMEVQPAMENGATCSECGRSARAIVKRESGNISFEIVQTGGDDPPEWLPQIRRV